MEVQSKLKENGLKFSKTYCSGPCYIFSNGEFLNLYEQEPKMTSHFQIDMFLSNKDILSFKDIIDYQQTQHLKNQVVRGYISGKSRALKFTDNAIVLNDGRNLADNCYIDLPEKDLTKSQLSALTEWLDYIHLNVSKRGNLYVNLNDDMIEYKLAESTADDVLKDINKIYNKKKNEEHKLILAFDGLGSEMFCNTTPKWVYVNTFNLWDSDEEKQRFIDTTNNYNIIVSASKSSMAKIREISNKLTIYLPENTPEAKAFLIEHFKNYLRDILFDDNYDFLYKYITDNIQEGDEVIYVPAGKTIEDILK